MTEDDPNYLSKVITGDENWVYGYDLEIMQQLSEEPIQIQRKPIIFTAMESQC